MSKSIARLLTLVLLASTLSACGGSSSGDNSPPPPGKTETVGPYDIQFDGNGTFNQVISFIPASASGKIDFRLISPQAQTITIAAALPSAEGCGLAQVKWVLGWFDDSIQTTGKVVQIGVPFWVPATAPGQYGVLQLQLSGLTGCSRFGFSLGLTR